MTPPEMLLLFAAAVAASALNAVAGGGSFFTFPALLFAGVPPVLANATSTVALWPGTLASAGAYRSALATRGRVLLVLGAASLAGGLVGAVVLLGTPDRTFARLIPWLLLAATLLFALGPRLTRRLRGSAMAEHAEPSAARLWAIAAVQLVVAVYGGYFGGGMGMLILAALAVLGMENVHAMNALKVVLGILINGVAVVTFVAAGAVVWGAVLVMVAGSVLGGWAGAHYAQKVPAAHVRRFVIAVGVALTAYFFLRPA